MVIAATVCYFHPLFFIIYDYFYISTLFPFQCHTVSILLKNR